MTDMFFGFVLGVILCAVVETMRRLVLSLPVQWSRGQRVSIELGAAAAIIGGTLAACGSPDTIRCQLDAIKLLPDKPAHVKHEDWEKIGIQVVTKLNDCRAPVPVAVTPAPAPVQDAGK